MLIASFFFRLTAKLKSIYDFFDCLPRGRIIKWTQHIGLLTLAGISPVVEGNHGNDLKEG